jgi:hypothetical protein
MNSETEPIGGELLNAYTATLNCFNASSGSSFRPYRFPVSSEMFAMPTTVVDPWLCSVTPGPWSMAAFGPTTSVEPGAQRTKMFTALSLFPSDPTKIIGSTSWSREETKDGQTATYEPIRPEPKRAWLLESVSPPDNRGCFHAASVLTACVIGSFGALAPMTVSNHPKTGQSVGASHQPPG